MVDMRDILGGLLQSGLSGSTNGRLANAMGPSGLGQAGNPLSDVLSQLSNITQGAGGGAGGAAAGSGGGSGGWQSGPDQSRLDPGSLESIDQGSFNQGRLGQGGGLGGGGLGGGGLGGILGGLAGALGGGGSGGSAGGGQGGGQGGGLGDILGGLAGALGGGGSGGSASGGLGGSPLAMGGLAALIGALLGGGRGATRGALGGGLMAVLGSLAVSALQKRAQATGQANAAVPPPAGLYEPTTPAEEQALDEASGLVIQAMINAAKADGQIDPAEKQRILGKLTEDGCEAEAQAFVEAEMHKPLDTAGLVQAVAGRPDLAIQVYAASLLAIEVDTPVEENYLRTLATNLQLDPATVASIHQAFGVKDVAMAGASA